MTVFQTPEAKRGVGRALAYYKIANLSRYDSVETAVIMSAAGLETLAAYTRDTGRVERFDVAQCQSCRPNQSLYPPAQNRRGSGRSIRPASQTFES